jgi:hypothetical protein
MKQHILNRHFVFIVLVYYGVLLNKVGNVKVSFINFFFYFHFKIKNLDCGINAHRHCKDQVVMECRQKRQHQVNKQGSVTDSRPSRSSFRIRKTRKQKGTQTEDINFSSSSSSATSESCTSSSDNEQQQPHQQIIDKSTHHHYWHLRKPPSLKHRKQVLSDSNDDYYYTHPPPSPQQASSLTTITTVNSSTSTNIIPTQQLIPRGPLICSDSFEKWNDRCFTWNRPIPSSTLLSPIPSISTTTTTTETTIIKSDNDEKSHQQPLYGHGSFLEGDVSDDDTCFTSNTNDITLQQLKMTTNYGSSQHLNPRKLSLTESLRSLPTKSESNQYEIFQRLRQAEEVRNERKKISFILFYLGKKTS